LFQPSRSPAIDPASLAIPAFRPSRRCLHVRPSRPHASVALHLGFYRHKGGHLAPDL